MGTLCVLKSHSHGDCGNEVYHAPRITNHMPMSFLVIGYGNPLRGDDGVGWAVVERLERTAAAVPLTLITRHQLLPELSDLIAQATGVLFVDAAADGEPGSICITPLSPDPTGPASSHQMGPGVLLAYTQELYGHCPPATLITVTGESFGYEEKLSPRLAALVATICGDVLRVIQGANSSVDAVEKRPGYG